MKGLQAMFTDRCLPDDLPQGIIVGLEMSSSIYQALLDVGGLGGNGVADLFLQLADSCRDGKVREAQGPARGSGRRGRNDVEADGKLIVWKVGGYGC